jgi:Effector-associated domain 9
MHRTLEEHIQDLEQRLKLISSQMMREDNPKKRNNLESELRAIESALTQYRSAFEIESRLWGEFPLAVGPQERRTRYRGSLR